MRTPAYLRCSELEVALILLHVCACGALAVPTHRDALGEEEGTHWYLTTRREAASGSMACPGNHDRGRPEASESQRPR
ncbi:MAG: hypothetical protein AAF355_13395, partial [Myxococcota bacterium]